MTRSFHAGCSPTENETTSLTRYVRPVCTRPCPRQPRVCTALSTAATPQGSPASSTGDRQRRTRAAGLGRPKDAASLPAARVHLEGPTLEQRKSGGQVSRVSLTWNFTKQMNKGKETKNQTLKPREGAGGHQRGGGGRGTGGEANSSRRGWGRGQETHSPAHDPPRTVTRGQAGAPATLMRVNSRHSRPGEEPASLRAP